MVQLLRVLMITGLLMVSAQVQADSLTQTLKTMLGKNGLPLFDNRVTVQLSQKLLLEQFYLQRDYKLAWATDSNAEELSAQLLSAIDKASEDGLDRFNRVYHKILIQQLSNPITAEDQVFRDLLLSDAFMTLGLHLHHGFAFRSKVDTLHRVIKPNTLNLPELLENALLKGQIDTSLTSLAPTHQRYLNLKKALHHYRKLAEQGGWNEEPDAYLDPEQVKKRLMITGEYYDEANLSLSLLNEHLINELFDDCHEEEPIACYKASLEEDQLTDAVKIFQDRQNISVDGIIGEQTRIHLAESVQQVIERIRLNLERWRWFNPIADNNYIMVNIPGFSLQYMRDDQELLMQVIVGKKRRQTPMMQAEMSFMVFNPYWRIPKTILTEDILPKLRKDKEYLRSNKINLFSSADRTESLPLDATTIDWNSVTKQSILHYRFRQESGPKNPLGEIKFMFPNNQDIYIHDTSARYLFQNRTFLASSGCIRAEKPMQLAYEILVREQPETTYDSLYQKIQAGGQKAAWLKDKIPVYLTYQTAWADESGTLRVHKDVYDYDTNLLNFMKLNAN